MTSDSFTALLDRNRSFAEQFAAGDLTIRPRMSTIILTCIDARVDPAHLFGLGLGDAVVIRNERQDHPRSDGGSRHYRRSGRQHARARPYAAGTCRYPPHRLRNVSSHQPGHPGTGGKTARPQCRRSVGNGDQRPHHVCARRRRPTPPHPRNARPTGRLRVRLRRKQWDVQPSCATGPTPRLPPEPKVEPGWECRKDRNLLEESKS